MQKMIKLYSRIQLFRIMALAGLREGRKKKKKIPCFTFLATKLPKWTWACPAI